MCSRVMRAKKEISACAFFAYTKTNFPRVLHFSAFILCCMHAYTVRHCNCAKGLHFSAFINSAKKKDLLGLLSFVPPIYHSFYHRLVDQEESDSTESGDCSGED